jgi:hypothetical protein
VPIVFKKPILQAAELNQAAAAARRVPLVWLKTA